MHSLTAVPFESSGHVDQGSGDLRKKMTRIIYLFQIYFESMFHYLEGVEQVVKTPGDDDVVVEANEKGHQGGSDT